MVKCITKDTAFTYIWLMKAYGYIEVRILLMYRMNTHHRHNVNKVFKISLSAVLSPTALYRGRVVETYLMGMQVAIILI